MDSGRREAISGGVGATYLEDDRGAFLEWEIPVGTVGRLVCIGKEMLGFEVMWRRRWPLCGGHEGGWELAAWSVTSPLWSGLSVLGGAFGREGLRSW